MPQTDLHVHAQGRSQFGDSPGSLEATLAELVALARHLRAKPADIPRSLLRLEGLHHMLTFFTTPVEAFVPRLQAPLDRAQTRCAFEGCDVTWRSPDACLLNFAPRDTAALWLCRAHHPPLGDGGIRPPGWRPPVTESEREEAERAAAMARLTKDQLILVNGRMRGA